VCLPSHQRNNCLDTKKGGEEKLINKRGEEKEVFKLRLEGGGG